MQYNGKSLRHEIKYIINQTEYRRLKSKLGHVLEQDVNTTESGSYMIRSLYFDDVYDSAYHEKNDGVFKRTKYRIRVYNKSKSVIKLELKEKYNKYISKQSNILTLEQYYKILNGKLRHADIVGNDFLLKFFVEVKTKRLSPRIIVDYDREAYIHKNGNVRITFDKKLRTVIDGKDVFCENERTFPVMSADKMILEVKYDDYLPQFINATLKAAHHQIISASKFVMCCDAELAVNWKELI